MKDFLIGGHDWGLYNDGKSLDPAWMKRDCFTQLSDQDEGRSMGIAVDKTSPRRLLSRLFGCATMDAIFLTQCDSIATGRPWRLSALPYTRSMPPMGKSRRRLRRTRRPLMRSIGTLQPIWRQRRHIRSLRAPVRCINVKTVVCRWLTRVILCRCIWERVVVDVAIPGHLIQ